ncbi:MAG TPA: archaeal heat shock protein Hsp14 [Nitrososphaeraceae archaeon]|nr:archaeal heat shock protein Hsp14 [Nitrososphaeraceae archaeon]
MVYWELTKELGKRSRDFFEFVLRAIDMVEEKNDLVVRIDLPGFTKENISLRIVEDILTINAKRGEQEQPIGTQYYKQRPLNISRKITLPFSTSDGEKVVGTAKYEDGVVTLRIPIPKVSYIPIT